MIFSKIREIFNQQNYLINLTSWETYTGSVSAINTCIPGAFPPGLEIFGKNFTSVEAFTI